MDRPHAELDEGWSGSDLDDFEGDLERELRRE